MMMLREIEIRNFKMIENIKINLKPGVNILYGPYNSGKTSILEALAIGLDGFTSGIENVQANGVKKNHIRYSYYKSDDGAIVKNEHIPLEVNCKADINGVMYCWQRMINTSTPMHTSVKPTVICSAAYNMARDNKTMLPVIIFQSLENMQKKNRKYIKFTDLDYGNRTIGYKNCLNGNIDIDYIYGWIKQKENQEEESGEPMEDYQTVKQIFTEFMVHLGFEDCTFFYDSNEIYVEIDNNIAPLHTLGYEMYMNILTVLNIIIRMAVLNSGLNNLNQTPGIVLIDNMDSYVAVGNFEKYLNTICSVFPNLQLVITVRNNCVFRTIGKSIPYNLITL